MDDGEQYRRRICLRIDGIPLPANGREETPEEIRETVKKVIKEVGASVPDDAIDRAHRIGKDKIVEGKRNRQVIVRFVSFHYRSLIYKARKNSKKYRIYLDLTKNRSYLLSKANELIKQKKLKDSFAFADLNCRLCLKLGNKSNYFSTYDDLMEILG